ncbi:putative peptide/nitrate transporter [Platanthera guangdongensis]|uniref:Peptide/nitrate transporter n=1 Tax=Platanthera guangdongensis TaxID=2320717 RepID=A0ABR2MTD9_9ASPA
MFSSFLGGLVATLGLVYIQESLGWGSSYRLQSYSIFQASGKYPTPSSDKYPSSGRAPVGLTAVVLLQFFALVG